MIKISVAKTIWMTLLQLNGFVLVQFLAGFHCNIGPEKNKNNFRYKLIDTVQMWLNIKLKRSKGRHQFGGKRKQFLELFE